MTRVHLLTFRKTSVFTFKVETYFAGEGIKLLTSLVSPRSLNTKVLTCTRDELNHFSSPLFLVKMEDLGCLSLASLRNTKGLGALAFSILLKTKGAAVM